MSILAAAPAPNPRGEIVFAVICLAFGLAAAAALRRWRRGAGGAWRERVGSRTSPWPLVAVMGAGLVCWFALPIGFFTYRQAQLIAQEGPDAKLDVENMPARDLAFLATVPPVAGFLALVVGDLALRQMGNYWFDLGFGVRRLGSGLLWGLLASLCVVPLVFGLMVFIDLAYRWLQYQHPEEHELLRALGETSDPVVKVPLLLGAALVAPLFEELLFRGHIQTVLRRAIGSRYVSPAVRPIVVEAQAFDPGAAPYVLPMEPMPAVALPDPLVPRWVGWLAVAITSALFAVVHPMWTWPPIFILSLCLGYAYERTGNLWVPMVIHAAFNSTSTVLYLAGVSN